MKRLLATFLVLAGTAGVACYQDDALHAPAISPTRVFITDAPFPFDTVGSVNLYVTKIEACSCVDSQAGNWVTLAAPNKSFDLLTLQQGTTAFVGESPIDAGQYNAIRMTINVDQSSIKYKDGTSAVVHWSASNTGDIVLNTLIEKPLAVSATGSEIVIDFDVGSSFVYNLTGGNDFLLLPHLRAVTSAGTGTIAGIVTQAQGGGFVPVENADVTVYGGDPNRSSSTWYVVATGHTSQSGDYHVGFLMAGTYIVSIEAPGSPWLAAVTTPAANVVAGATDSVSVVLPPAAVGTYLNITGPLTVGVGGTIVLHAAVGDSNGHPEASPQVSWLSRDTTIAVVLQDSAFIADSLANAFVLGRGLGTAWVVASSGTLRDSVQVQVISTPPSNSVATVTLTPPSMTLAKGDSNFFTATLKDSAGNTLTTPQISWYLTDSTGTAVILWSSGTKAWVAGIRSGTTHIRAASESKFKDAAITVP